MSYLCCCVQGHQTVFVSRILAMKCQDLLCIYSAWSLRVFDQYVNIFPQFWSSVKIYFFFFLGSFTNFFLPLLLDTHFINTEILDIVAHVSKAWIIFFKSSLPLALFWIMYIDSCSSAWTFLLWILICPAYLMNYYWFSSLDFSFGPLLSLYMSVQSLFAEHWQNTFSVIAFEVVAKASRR